jgi:putative NADH-flavin reductase
MKLAIFGATGGTGRHLVEEALSAGHDVTALVRDPARLAAKPDSRLMVLRGSVLDAGEVSKAVTGVDAVLSAIGGSTLQDESTVSTAAGVIASAMAASGVRRLVAMGSAGIFGEVRGIAGLVTRTLLRHALVDHRKQYDLLAASDLDWVLVRATRLTDGPRTGAYRLAREGLPPRGAAISRADVADFMLRALGDDTWLRSAPAIAY